MSDELEFEVDEDIYSSLVLYVDVNLGSLPPRLGFTVTDATDQIYDQMWLESYALLSDEGRDDMVDLLTLLYRRGMVEEEPRKLKGVSPERTKEVVTSALEYARSMIRKAEEGLVSSLIDTPEDKKTDVYVPYNSAEE